MNFMTFKTCTFSGELTGSVEGSVKWMTLDEMLAGKLAPNMTKYLELENQYHKSVSEILKNRQC